MFDTVVVNGSVVLESEAVEAAIGIKEGKIAAIGDLPLRANKVIDARGMVVLPGMIDAHVHISEPGRTEWEGYVTGTKAAAKGGVTSFIEMPLNQLPATIDHRTLQLKLQAAEGKLSVDVALFGGLVPHNLDRLHELDRGGVVAYKCFLATCGFPDEPEDFRNVDDYSLFMGMSEIAKTGKVLAIHAENAAICDALGRIAQEEGRTSYHDYVASRPVFTEVEAIRRAITFSQATGCRIHIVHISSAEGVAEVTRARSRGVPVTCESCTHYFVINQDQLEQIGALAKCSPPLRSQSNQDLLWQKLFDGEILFITSDHSPAPPEMKEGHAFEAWGGIAGLQNNVDIMFDEAVQKRGMGLVQFAKIIATNPAELYSLNGKGRIAIGYDADLVLVKPDSPYTLTADMLEYRHKIGPYLGRTIGAQVARTLLRGHTIYTLSEGVSDQRLGQMLRKHVLAHPAVN